MNVKKQSPLIQLLIDWFSYRRGVLQLIKIIFPRTPYGKSYLVTKVSFCHCIQEFPSHSLRECGALKWKQINNAVTTVHIRKDTCNSLSGLLLMWSLLSSACARVSHTCRHFHGASCFRFRMHHALRCIGFSSIWWTFRERNFCANGVDCRLIAPKIHIEKFDA